ncbi:PO210-like protein, partial [Mya arenaria]
MAAPMVLAMAAFFNWKLLFVISTAFLLSMSVNEGARLSDPKVLMPFYSSVVTNFTLKINLTRDEARTPSCYTWRSSRLDVATVQLINSTDNECALSAEISAVSKSSMRKTSIVLVENKVTGEVLKCIVIVDELSRIEIETTTRLLYLEDSPEEMIVRGYDSDGNVFSSLQGLEFEWSLHSDTSGSHDDIVDANSILRILKFSDSHYTTPIHIEKLEDRDRQGDVILVEGMKTGSAFSVAHSSVRLMVIANLIVSPPEAYILKFATVKYKVEQIRQNSVVAITMPSAQFYLEAVESGICNLDPTTSVATALELGETEVKLIDKSFTVLPDRKWVLETGRVYTILIDAYDLHSHKLHPSDNVMIESMFPEKYFEVLFSTKNGTYHVVRTLKKGETDLEGSLDTVIKQDGSEFKITPALSQTQFVEIFDPIVVRPELLFFPWDPVKQLSHKYQLAASGGSGDYIWSSNDPTVATVNKYGEVTTSNLGETEVTAADRRNTLHKGTAKIHILPPSGMEFRPERVEVVVGSYLPLPLDVQTILGGRVYSFHDCRNMPLNVTFSDPSVVELPIDPEKEAVVTLGSSKEVVFSGGPQPWVLDSSKYFQILSSGESKNVLIHPIPVYCKKSLDILVSVTDKNGRKFDNISSLEFDWSLSDTSLASLPYDLESEVTVTLTGRKIVSNTMLLRPNGVPGLETITVSVSSYKQEYLNAAKSTQSAKITPTITKTLDLRLVEEAVVSPETLAVFNHPSNKVAVDIDRGSGYFYVVEGRTEVIDLKYQEKAKKIQIIPIKDGQLTVTIYDLCIATSQPAQITVTVSGVGSVQLYVMDKVEVGQDVKARVEVLDVSGERLRDQASAPDKYSALYTVHGSVVGHTTLKAIVQLPDRSNVTSAVRPVEVFPPLELIPRNITLIIGALFQVLSRGGPRPQCTVEYSIRNSDIALVSSSGLLKAQELGATRVVGQAVGQDPETGGTVVYSQDEAIVNVVRLVGVKIHAPLTRLQSGTTMPMFAVGLTEHETPFMFGASVPPFSFKWTVNKKDVAHLQSVYHKSNISPGQEGNFGSQLVAIETGHVSVRLQVTPVKGQGQVVGDDVLTDELQVQVFEELVMLQPRVCDGDLLMTPNTEAVLKTNRDGGAQMSYEVVGQGREVATVVDGVLISGPTQGQAALHVTAMEESGVVQTLVVMVKVKPVSYLMINSDTQLRTSGQTLSTVPRGATLLFTVTYHDDVGASFYSTNIDMRFRCSRYDLAQVNHGLDNNTIVMKTASVGQTILKVWDNYKPWLMDYINVPVGNAIEPALPSLSVGSVVCFTAPLTTDNGISNAQHPGPASLTYTVSDDVLTSTEVQLEPVGIVTMESGSEFVSTVTKNGDTVFTVYVNLGDTPTVQGSGCLSLISEQNYKPPSMPFTCDLGLNYGGQNLDIGDLFTIKPVFISKQGRYACQIKPVSSTSTSKISTAEISVVVTATVTEFKGQREVKAKPLSLPFLPPFHIHNTEIHVSTLTPLSSVRVSTNVKMASQIQVVVSDPSILEALPPESDAQSNDIIIYPIKLLNSVALWEREQLDVWVNLIGRKTGQKVKIPVFIRLIGQKPDISSLGDVGWRKLFSSILHNYQYWFILLIIIFVTALTVLFGYHAVYGPRYNAAANTSFVQSPKGSPVPQNYSPRKTDLFHSGIISNNANMVIEDILAARLCE